MTAIRLGAMAGFAVAGVGVLYAIVLGYGMARFGLSAPIRDPVLAVMEVLTVAAAFPLVVHAVELTAGRQLGGGGLVWPSTAYAIELLAWDLFLGISLLCAAATLDPARAPKTPRRLVQMTGTLCLVGIIGPAVGNMRLQLIGVIGYAVLLPASAFRLAQWFGARRRAGTA